MIKLVPLLNLTPTKTDLELWDQGYYELKRVDCTAMWELPRRADVRAWLRAAEFQSKSRHGRPIMTGGTLYFGKHSRRWSVKFYAKGDELEAKVKGHKLPDEILLRDKLMEWADNKLRGELTLRSTPSGDIEVTRPPNINSGCLQGIMAVTQSIIFGHQIL